MIAQREADLSATSGDASHQAALAEVRQMRGWMIRVEKKHPAPAIRSGREPNDLDRVVQEAFAEMARNMAAETASEVQAREAMARKMPQIVIGGFLTVLSIVILLALWNTSSLIYAIPVYVVIYVVLWLLGRRP